MNNRLSRRALLKRFGTGMAAGLVPGVLPRALAQVAPATPTTCPPINLSGKTPISLIVDDAAPLDPLFYELPGYETPWLVPGEFTRRVAGASAHGDGTT